MIAYLEGLMGAAAADVVALAWMENPSRKDLRKLDLRLLAEYERKPGGAVRVKLVDRVDLAVAAIRQGLCAGEGQLPEQLDFLRALGATPEPSLLFSDCQTAQETPAAPDLPGPVGAIVKGEKLPKGGDSGEN